MKTDLFFNAGTGNSLRTAGTPAKEPADTEVVPIRIEAI